MRFDQLRLRVPDVECVKKFYCDILGMTITDKGLCYAADGLKLVFEQTATKKRSSTGRDGYWKIGITVKDLNSVVNDVRKAGVEVSEPLQFKDIGYVSHMKDPSGLGIELLQQGFEGKSKPGGPIQEQATLAHITLRIADLSRAREICERDFGMRLMSVQGVPEYKFTLYFYSWSDEELPDSDVTSVANREWLWARSYPLLELQHLESASPEDIKSTSDGEAGPIDITCCDTAGELRTLTGDHFVL